MNNLGYDCINALDIETYEKNNTLIPYCISYNIYNTSKVIYIDECYNICEHVIDEIFNNMKYNNITIFIHNIEFDGRLFVENLSINNFLIKMIIKNRTIYSMTIKKKNSHNKSILLKCSYKLFPISLKKAAIMLNIKEKMKYPYKFINENTLQHNNIIKFEESKMDYEDYIIFINEYKKINSIKEYTKIYCENDVIITKKLIENMNKMISKYNININKKKILSISSLSLNIFFNNFNNKNINLKYSENLDNLVRKSYYGGRCEVFGNAYDDEKVFHYDFPGMYSQCMKERFPIGEYYINYNVKDINKTGFYYIKYKSNMSIPILPHHNKNNFKLLFTNGFNEGLYWFEEILLFIENGGEILDITYAIIYDNYDYCFTDFINEFDKLRQIGGEYKTFSKMVVNSLYGRLAMKKKNEKTELINIDEFYNIINKYKINSASFYSKYVLISYESDNNYNLLSNIAISSATTAKARIKLYNAYKSVIKNNGRILYSDTDSIFAAYKKNVINEKHGEIYWDSNLQDTIIKDSVFISPKQYGVIYDNNKEIIKIKGFDVKNINFIDLKNNFYNNINLKNNIYILHKNINIKYEIIEKMIKMNTYDKRKWTENMKSTEPLFLLDGYYK